MRFSLLLLGHGAQSELLRLGHITTEHVVVGAVYGRVTIPVLMIWILGLLLILLHLLLLRLRREETAEVGLGRRRWQ